MFNFYNTELLLPLLAQLSLYQRNILRCSLIPIKEARTITIMTKIIMTVIVILIKIIIIVFVFIIIIIGIIIKTAWFRSSEKKNSCGKETFTDKKNVV